jgi:hypothetical protein
MFINRMTMYTNAPSVAAIEINASPVYTFGTGRLDIGPEGIGLI